MNFYQNIVKLPSTERAEVVAFLKTKDHYSLEELCAYVKEHYGVVYKSKQSYDDLLHEAHISWKNTEHAHPAHDADNVLARRAELQALLHARRTEIESGDLVVLLDDECHLLWGDT